MATNQMKGNVHVDRAEASAMAETYAMEESTLAVAFEARTANLLAFLDLVSQNKIQFAGDSTAYMEAREQVLERLGLEG